MLLLESRLTDFLRVVGTDTSNLYETGGVYVEMSEMTTSAPACYKVACRGNVETFDRPISVLDVKKVAKANALVTFHAHDIVSGRELDEKVDFPFRGDVELRTYAAPKVQ